MARDQFTDMPDDELRRYAEDWGIERRDEITRDDLIKALRSREGSTGTAPESTEPLQHKGPAQPGHQRGEQDTWGGP